MGGRSIGEIKEDVSTEREALASTAPVVEWTNPRTGEVRQLRFWQGVAQGVSLMLLCTDSEGRFRAYRAEECRAVQP